MSQGTPAKQQRLERHLMRQRGAGARSVTTDFGFSFSLGPAVATTTVTTSTAEPPSKRRKTEDLDTVDKYRSALTKDQAIEIAERPLDVEEKAEKIKRRLPEEVGEVLKKVVASCGDDSFLAQCKPKKKRTNKQRVTAAPDLSSKCVSNSEPAATTGRPRRRAAISAAAKVVSDLAEENISVDRKRRDASPDTLGARRGGRQRTVKAGEEMLASKLPTPPPSQALGNSTEHQKAPPELESSPKVKATKKRKPLEGAAARTSQPASIEQPLPRVKNSPAKPPEAVCRKNARKGPHVDEVAPPTATQPPTDRTVLAEADANIVRLSVSPEKPTKSCGRLKRQPACIANTKWQEDAGRLPKQRAAKARKLHVERDAADSNTSKPAQSETPDDEATLEVALSFTCDEVSAHVPRSKSAKPKQTSGVAQPQDGSSAQQVESDTALITARADSLSMSSVGTASANILSNEHGHLLDGEELDIKKPCSAAEDGVLEPTPGKQSKKSAVVRRAKPSRKAAKTIEPVIGERNEVQIEEDVDWLFAPQVEKPVPDSHARSKPGNRNCFGKLADVDLDDLVTNIASFAAVRGGATITEDALPAVDAGASMKKPRRKKA